MTLSKEKFEHMKAVSNEDGIIAAAAMDQRGSLKKSIAAARGIDADAVTDAMMEEFKTAVTKVLAPHATAMLLDPVWGLPASATRPDNVGLLLAYEQSGYDNTQEGRLPNLLDGYSVQRLKDEGANCCKILLYYSPFEDAGVNQIKHDWVQKIGEECEAVGLPFFLEFVGYDVAGNGEKSLEYAKLKPEVVRLSMQEFDKPQYKVDVMKIEIPVNLAYTEGCESFAGEGVAYTRDEAIALYQRTAEVTNKPFIYLSAGVSDAQFRESLEIANESGVAYSGVLCGRATWKDGIPVYGEQGAEALEVWLQDRGVQNIKALNEVIYAGATPWWNAYGGFDKVCAA